MSWGVSVYRSVYVLAFYVQLPKILDQKCYPYYIFRRYILNNFNMFLFFRYLCDFSYFVSLNINRFKSAFVHVPPLDNPYSGQELADGLEQVILSMLKQINGTIVQS